VHDGVAARLAPLLGRILLGQGRTELPIRVIAWDGSSIGPADAPAFVIRHRRALRRLLWKPGEMGLVRAYIAGELDIEGDVIAALGAVQDVMRAGARPIRLSSDDKREIVRTAVTLGAVGPEPKPPAEEFPLGATDDGTLPLEESADFAALVLGPSMSHGCAAWPAPDLETAQRTEHARLCAHLGLRPGMRLLDVSCGWGAFVRYATAEHGVQAVGLTRSARQAAHGNPADIRHGTLEAAGSGPYDVIVARGALTEEGLAAPRLHDLLVPGGRLLVQQMTRRPGPHAHRRTFTTSYVFPGGGELRSLGGVIDALESADLEVREVTARREDQAATLRAWAAALQTHWTGCAALSSPGRARVWLLYLAASALACESGRVGYTELTAVRRNPEHPVTTGILPGTAALTR
jgi:cyclopropane-fatty-acyl-phospholipid synthase